MNTYTNSDGWFCRRQGEVISPLTTTELQNLLASHQLDPERPVWRKEREDLVFLHAGTAVLAEDNKMNSSREAG